MTGDIIYFRRHLALKRGSLYRQQAVPRRAPAARRALHGPELAGEDRNEQPLEQQVARVARLLEELEELAGSAKSCPPATLEHARSSIEKARRLLRPLAGGERQVPLDDDDGDPQPEIDDEKLERMYRVISPDA